MSFVDAASLLRYFGRAKELPGVKELFESKKKEEEEENQALAFYKKFMNQSPGYFGDLDEQNPELLKYEREAEDEGELSHRLLSANKRLTVIASMGGSVPIRPRCHQRLNRRAHPAHTSHNCFHYHRCCSFSTAGQRDSRRRRNGRRGGSREDGTGGGCRGSVVHPVLDAGPPDAAKNANTGADGGGVAGSTQACVGRGVLRLNRVHNACTVHLSMHSLMDVRRTNKL